MLRSTLCGLLLGLPACQLLNTEDTENVPGRGSTAFDPYAASASGAIKLSLQMFNGCAILSNGQPVAKGNSPVPDYPAQCDDPMAADPTHSPKITPQQRFQVMTDTKYFLNQITLTDTVANVHTDASNLAAVSRWIRKESRFKDLDWSDMSQEGVRWYETLTEGTWSRELRFRNARWMLSQDDTFTLEVLDSDGSVRQTATYSRKDFAGESPVAGHTNVSYVIENLLPPRSPSDGELRPVPSPLPGLGGIQYRTMVRVDLVGSTNPFKDFRVLGVSGDGAIRLTWSLMPNSPFTIPVTFVRPSDVPPTCFKDDDSPTPCAFGLDPRVNLSRPKNGQFYVPGERFDVIMDVRDGEGNRLHRKELMPSFADFYGGNTNGLIYGFEGHLITQGERDTTTSYQVVGPLQDLKTWSSVAGPTPYFSAGGSASATYVAMVPEIASLPIIPGLPTATWPTRSTLTLPPDAKPGTYVILTRAVRQFMGEHVSKGNASFFQVGQAERTSYPNRVGNCQTCHRGVVSLDNLRHGFSVDHVESCKACHMSTADLLGRVQDDMHRLHMNSNKYPQNKADCRMCHLTRESAVRPSLTVCKSCHPTVHGDEYFSMAFTNSGAPSRFSNCAQSCHVEKTPSGHILPD
ncbi:cytochrome c3 family protein [Melittangium boletus]|uniref:cytochrome c3 family protein n=1 Tax=Melittangium boletus TaxID=83453 RepID=UPI001FECF337|nr:cytochrome c3 family protein [Melittangium boletus]